MKNLLQLVFAALCMFTGVSLMIFYPEMYGLGIAVLVFGAYWHERYPLKKRRPFFSSNIPNDVLSQPKSKTKTSCKN